jgi:hypothetical protein
MELLKASHQWSSRPDDERFLSLIDIRDHFDKVRSESRELVVPSRRLFAEPSPDNKGITILGANETPHAPTHWSFGQLAQLAEAPAGYLRTLPSPIAADCINYGLQFKRNIEDVGLLLQDNGDHIVRAATGPNYGRVWNGELVDALIRHFGDGVNGRFRVPGEFGKEVPITTQNTTLYAGDRDLFVFLADEKNRVEIPNRRDGKPGLLARGFFSWNSEVGSATYGFASFLYDYVCCNRIVWGATEYKEIRVRHTASAPDKFVADVVPALEVYAESPASNIVEAVKAAQAKNLGDKVEDFLAKRFGKRLVQSLQTIHQLEEGRPIETLWDVTTAATAYARNIKWQDQRVAIERTAGEVLQLAA